MGGEKNGAGANGSCGRQGIGTSTNADAGRCRGGFREVRYRERPATIVTTAAGSLDLGLVRGVTVHAFAQATRMQRSGAQGQRRGREYADERQDQQKSGYPTMHSSSGIPTPM